MMLGSQCSPCCDTCGGGKPYSDPKDEGTWVPSGTWRDAGGVTWTFVENPGDESGETWFFLGNLFTSKKGGAATGDEQMDWGNICNWYSKKTTAPDVFSLTPTFTKRATRLPPENATVHIYSPVSTEGFGGATVARAYFWSPSFLYSGVLTATEIAHDSAGGVVFGFSSGNRATVNGGATFTGMSYNYISAIVNGGATFNDTSNSDGTVNGGATFNDSSHTYGTVNGGATFNDSGTNYGTVFGGATFNESSDNRGSVFGGATFNDSGTNYGTVFGGATFNESSSNFRYVNDGATFNDGSINHSSVFGGATYNNSSNHARFAAVSGGATFNDSACSTRIIGFGGVPCSRKFVAHPTDIPVCNGTAPKGCDLPLSGCGCG